MNKNQTTQLNSHRPNSGEAIGFLNQIGSLLWSVSVERFGDPRRRVVNKYLAASQTMAIRKAREHGVAWFVGQP